MSRKVLVVHEGKRDDYQVVRALVEGGDAVDLVTSGYPGKLTFFLNNIFSIRSISKLNARLITDYPPKSVSSCTLLEIILRGAQKIIGESFVQEAIDKSISRRASKLLRNGNYDVVVAYNYNAFSIFHNAPAGLRKIIFQCHPHPKLIAHVMALAAKSGFAPDRVGEREFIYSPSYVAMLYSEHFLADAAICASQFTAASLKLAGFEQEKISVIPYGRSELFVSPDNECPPRLYSCKKIKLIFVGQFVHRKGLLTLAQILNELDFAVDIKFVGRGIIELDPLSLINNTHVTASCEWDVPFERLVQLYQEYEVFIFPTLVEGFAHVILEAMSAGCVPVVSTNSCGPDLIENNLSGFVIDPLSPGEYVSALRSLQDPKIRAAFSAAARESATTFTWSKFRSAVRAVVI